MSITTKKWKQTNKQLRVNMWQGLGIPFNCRSGVEPESFTSYPVSGDVYADSLKTTP